MPLIVPLVGEAAFLEWAFRTHDPDLTIHLYQNNYTPVAGSTITDFVEATFDGYSPYVLGGWDPPAADGFGRYYTSPDEVTWTRGPAPPAEQIYGYYVTNVTYDIVWWAERFVGGPFYMGSAGLQIQVTAFFTDKSEF